MNKDTIKATIKKYIGEGLLSDAKEIISEYKKIFSYDDEVASMDSIINVYTGDLDHALECIREGLKYNIFNSDLYYTMGNVYELKGEYNKAYLCYEHAQGYVTEEENKVVIEQAIENLRNNFEISVKNYSIVLLTYNNLDYTKICVKSIKQYSNNNNYEIIIIDNNSTDDTGEWIKEQNGIKYILNDENKGFPAGCNQGVNLSERENDIFLLNNDTVIMPNSIFNLRMGLYSDESVGATGAVSNSVSYYQKISEQYNDFNGYMDYALKNNVVDEARYESRIKLVGFAMFIKRTVLDKVGLLDERFTPGNYEDDDISFRIILEGYQLLLCKDSYIHHFGSVSFDNASPEYRELLRVNSAKFKEKWGFISDYSAMIRHDVISLINEEKNKDIKVLEIGCACGASLLNIKNEYPNSEIYGIEINKDSAKIASCFADIRDENIENSNLTYDEGFFDYIILADVLEHLYEPEMVLRNLKKYLKDDGYILASIPNVMHYSVIRDLLNGNWTYQDAGILDRTHVRFFTKNEILKMFSNIGCKELGINSINLYKNESDETFINQLSNISSVNVKDEFEAYQYLIKALNSVDSDKEIEKKCTFLLRRIEFYINIEETERDIINHIKTGEFKETMILNVINNDIINKVHILNYVAIKCLENDLYDMIIPLLNYAYDLSPQDLDTNYNLAYVLNMIGERKIALEYLDNLNYTNLNVEELKEIIRGKINE